METTPIPPSARTLKVRAAKPTDSTASKSPKVVTVKRRPKTLAKTLVNTAANADLSEMIATAAYFRAQQRNFAPGGEVDDWLLAEQQITALQHKK